MEMFMQVQSRAASLNMASSPMCRVGSWFVIWSSSSCGFISSSKWCAKCPTVLVVKILFLHQYYLFCLLFNVENSFQFLIDSFSVGLITMWLILHRKEVSLHRYSTPMNLNHEIASYGCTSNCLLLPMSENGEMCGLSAAHSKIISWLIMEKRWADCEQYCYRFTEVLHLVPCIWIWMSYMN